MKVVLFCGGLGMRLRDYSDQIPKPMVNIGYRPILWHIMKSYSTYGINDFVICCGYRGDVIKEYFEKYDSDSWNVDLMDTGENTMTGGRLKRIKEKIDSTFCVTYGDGLSNININ